MATFNSLLDFVMPKAPRLTAELAVLEIRQAAIDFCRRSMIDRRTINPLNTVVGEAFYALDLPSVDVAVSQVLSVSINAESHHLSPIRPDEIPVGAIIKNAIPTHYSAEFGGTTLQLIFAPDAEYSLDVRVALEPTSTTDNLADWIASRYGNSIAHGALAELLANPKKPWTDDAMAAYYKSRFDAAIEEAKTEADQGFTSAPTRTRPVFGLR